MVEGLIFGAVGLALAVVIGLVGAVFALLFGLIALPFKILGWACKGLCLLLCLPFILAFGLIGVVLGGVGLLVFLIPIVPLIFLGLLFWFLIKGTAKLVTGN